MIIILLLLLTLKPTTNRIVMVQGLTRHCDRSPTSDLQFPYNLVDWSSKLHLRHSALTNVGIHQCFLMGQRIFDRYLKVGSENRIDGIRNEYSTIDYQFHSSNKERTSRSILSASFGMFPKQYGPKFSQVVDLDGSLREKDNYMLPNGTTPIIIESPEPENDILLRAYTLCNEISRRQAAYYNTHEWHEILKQYSDSFATFSSDKLGRDFTLRDFVKIHTQILFYRNHNLFTNISLSTSDYDYLSEILIELERYFPKLVMGKESVHFFMQSTLDSMKQIVENNQTIYPKFTLYGGHDTTILGVLAVLNLTSFYEELVVQPKYGSGIFFELHQDDDENGDYFVKIIYHDDFNSTDFVQYELDFSGDNETYKYYRDYIKNEVLVEDWCKICQFSRASGQGGEEYVIVGNGKVVVHQCLIERLHMQKIYNLSAEILLLVFILIVFSIAIGLIVCYVLQVRGKYLFERTSREKYEFVHDVKE